MRTVICFGVIGGEEGGARTHLLLALVISPLTTHPFRVTTHPFRDGTRNGGRAFRLRKLFVFVYPSSVPFHDEHNDAKRKNVSVYIRVCLPVVGSVEPLSYCTQVWQESIRVIHILQNVCGEYSLSNCEHVVGDQIARNWSFRKHVFHSHSSSSSLGTYRKQGDQIQ